VSAGRDGVPRPAVALAAAMTGEYEQVDHPAHYNSHPAGIECIDVIEHMSFNVGQVIKYTWRAGLKPGADVITDLRKARWHLDREIARLNRDEP
jgi:Protein of unknwon function (DUF3310)